MTLKCLDLHHCVLKSGLCHYGVRYGVRLYGTVRKYGVQRVLDRIYSTAYGTVQTLKASVKKLKLSFVSALQMAKEAHCFQCLSWAGKQEGGKLSG